MELPDGERQALCRNMMFMNRGLNDPSIIRIEVRREDDGFDCDP
jgi:hypothetical protein